MNRWVSVLLAALALTSAPVRAIGQTRGSVGSRPQGPTAARPPHPGPSPPSTAEAPPHRPTIIWSPTSVPVHRVFPVRSSWFGLVLFDPYWWEPSSVDQALLPPAALSPGDTAPTGGLQLDVEPRRALVYVDGWFVGIVDEFSGYYHHLDLAA